MCVRIHPREVIEPGIRNDKCRVSDHVPQMAFVYGSTSAETIKMKMANTATTIVRRNRPGTKSKVF